MVDETGTMAYNNNTKVEWANLLLQQTMNLLKTKQSGSVLKQAACGLQAINTHNLFSQTEIIRVRHKHHGSVIPGN